MSRCYIFGNRKKCLPGVYSMIGRGIGIPFRHGTGGGTSIPPEIKKNIIAWYDPKKQGMTNYDVIESYAEDFTASKWVTVQDRAVFTKTASKIHITESMSNGFNTSFIETSQSRYGNEMKINVSGIVAGGVTLKYRYGSYEEVVDITSNGVYTLPAGKAGTNPNGYNGFVMKAKGKCDITITQLPTSILKDLSGNGNHAYLYGGKGKLNSGMGVYQQDFSKLIISRVDKKQDPFSFTVSGSGGTYLAYMQLGNWNNKAFKILVNINSKSDHLYLRFRNSTEAVITSVMLKNGENIIPAQNIEGATKAVFEDFLKEGETITITQIPDYPDQLCYDGNMCAVAYEFPILTDYTVMAERTWFERQNRACFLSKITTSGTGAFGFEFYNEYNEDTTYSFGRANNVEYFKDGITYQITNSYNGIVKLDYIVNGKDNAELYIGKLRSSERNAFIGCHGAIIIADRSFTEEEINWLKNNLFTIDIPTPAYDFDFSKYKDGSNLGDSITDKYGNVLELHNFAWKGMSGLGGYPIDLKATFPRNYTDGRDYICNDKEITCSYIGRSGLFQVLMVNQDITKYIEIPEFTIKISGSENINLTYHYIKEDFTKGLLNIVGNGIYKIPKSYKADKIVENLNWLGFVLQNHMNENVDLKLEILPIYPGALVFDGIDDYARLAKMTIKTVVLDVIPKKQTTVLYDNRLNAASNWFSILNGENEIIAYNSHNDGFTYINGELNTTVKPNEIMNEKNVICVVNEKSEKANQFIGTSISLSGNANMVLYRITGFTEALTTDQVWKWYQKNKPKGGDK